MSSLVHTFSAKRISVVTKLPVSTLLAALDKELKRDTFVLGDFENRAQAALAKMDQAKFEEVVHSRLGESDFMIFSIRPMDRWFGFYATVPIPSVPKMITYTIGNPLIARTMITHDWTAGMNVPFNLIVVGTEQESKFVYDLPSASIAIGAVAQDVSEEEEGKLRQAALALDAKIEALLYKVIKAAEQTQSSQVADTPPQETRKPRM